MITANIYTRTLRLSTPEGFGTAFTIDVEGAQYLVTAKHVLPVSDPVTVELQFTDQRKVTVTLERADAEPSEADVSVLALPSPITPMYPIVPSLEGVVFTQDVYFLGFPFGLSLATQQGEEAAVFAFVKKAILSAAQWTSSGVHLLYLDGFNNPGFSGGPVVFTNQQTRVLHVAGVVYGYRGSQERVMVGERETPGYVLANTGIVLAVDIKHAVDAIRRRWVDR